LRAIPTWWIDFLRVAVWTGETRFHHYSITHLEANHLRTDFHYLAHNFMAKVEASVPRQRGWGDSRANPDKEKREIAGTHPALAIAHTKPPRPGQRRLG